MVPVSTQAFQQTQGSRRKLRERSADSLILDRKGRLRGIADIEFLGAFDRTLMPLLLHWFFGVGGIRVKFTEPLPNTLADTKRLVEEYIQRDENRSDWGLDEPPRLKAFLNRVQSAESFPELFDALHLPAPDDALDLL